MKNEKDKRWMRNVVRRTSRSRTCTRERERKRELVGMGNRDQLKSRKDSLKPNRKTKVLTFLMLFKVDNMIFCYLNFIPD